MVDDPDTAAELLAAVKDGQRRLRLAVGVRTERAFLRAAMAYTRSYPTGRPDTVQEDRQVPAFARDEVYFPMHNLDVARIPAEYLRAAAALAMAAVALRAGAATLESGEDPDNEQLDDAVVGAGRSLRRAARALVRLTDAAEYAWHEAEDVPTDHLARLAELVPSLRIEADRLCQGAIGPLPADWDATDVPTVTRYLITRAEMLREEAEYLTRCGQVMLEGAWDHVSDW